MKIEEAKALFMAQYLGQKVAVQQSFEVQQILDTQFLNGGIENTYLLLRSVQDLTDDEKIQCYHLHSGVIGYDYTQDFADVLTMANHWLNHDGYQTLFRFVCTANYLRTIGTLLPFTYLDDDNKPVTTSPATLISMGWARVK